MAEVKKYYLLLAGMMERYRYLSHVQHIRTDGK